MRLLAFSQKQDPMATSENDAKEKCSPPVVLSEAEKYISSLVDKERGNSDSTTRESEHDERMKRWRQNETQKIQKDSKYRYVYGLKMNSQRNSSSDKR